MKIMYSALTGKLELDHARHMALRLCHPKWSSNSFRHRSFKDISTSPQPFQIFTSTLVHCSIFPAILKFRWTKAFYFPSFTYVPKWRNTTNPIRKRLTVRIGLSKLWELQRPVRLLRQLPPPTRPPRNPLPVPRAEMSAIPLLVLTRTLIIFRFYSLQRFLRRWSSTTN